MKVDARTVPCPTCKVRVNEVCIGTTGKDRKTFHTRRTQAARAALQEANGTVPVSKVVQTIGKRSGRRFGAFLRLYGPNDARTHAVLVIGHGPEPDTPQGFLQELEVEHETEAIGKRHGIGTEWRIHFNGRPRIKPPTNPVRILNVVWKPGVCMPPMLCAGFKFLKHWPQAKVVAQETGGDVFPCACCGGWHLKRKGFNHGAISRPIG